MVRVVLLCNAYHLFSNFMHAYFTVPTPNVTIIASHDDIIVGQPLSLECIITTVRGINSQVNIRWSKGSNKEELKRESVTANVTMFSSVMYRDCLSIPQITTDDDNETYKCEVIINTSSPVTASDNYTVHVVGKNCCLNQACAGLWLVHTWFNFVWEIGIFVCVCART